MKRLVIGILAHVDSGKTTLSEGLLYTAGEIRRLGRVDHRDAFLDTNEIERDRGITIFSKQATLRFGDTEITLLDTPGHVDFSPETERTMCVLDYAILVISGTDGVQNHTETLWRLLARYNVPVFIFVNKTDITTLAQDELMDNLKTRLDDGCINFSANISTEEFAENLAVYDEDMMNDFLESGKIRQSFINKAILSRKIFPCFFGSALKLTGVKEFLRGLNAYTTMPIAGLDFGARVFKIAGGKGDNRLTYMKITGGSLKVRDILTGGGEDERWSEKVNQIRVYSGEKFTAVDEALPGTVCAVTGLTHTYPGEGLGAEPDSDAPVLSPVLEYKVNLPAGLDAHNALEMLKNLEEEDPQLHIVWNEALQEIHTQLMGEVQLEVLERIIAERFKVNITFGQGSIAYRETIALPVEGVGHYEPLRHYAEVHLLLEPLERGSGLVFKADCSEDALDRNWQRLILTHLAEKTHIGVLTGSPITDMKITLVAGRAHIKHTEGGDFRQATYRAVRHGLRNTESVLLEPWYDFELEVPSDAVGRAMTDIQQMSGTISPPEIRGDTAILTGSAPVACMRGYHTELTSYTRGKGRLFCSVRGYEECHNPDEVIAEINYDCDADLENTADSVFCSHGAGYVVNWQDVYSHMHLESAVKPEKAAEPIQEQQVCEYISRVADDDELLRIFEKTYGKVQRKNYNLMRTEKTHQQKKYPKARPLHEGPEYLLVDGYNIIFAWDELREISEHDLGSARDRLADILCNYQGFRQCEIILVFDAYKVKGSEREIEKYHNINVVYTKEAETADMYIEKVTHELSKKHRVRVATSDNLEQIIIMGGGALRMSADELLSEVKAVENAVREFYRQ